MKTCRAKLSTMFVVALAMYSGSAVSAEEQRPPSITVRYGDLNLSAAPGVEALKRRVLHAAMRVCGEQYAGDVLAAQFRHACERRATDRALAQIKWPQN
jgi:UrcA family protein